MNTPYPVSSLDNIKYVCIETMYDGKWVLSFHSRRKSWECPGGHVEAGEDPFDAAKRELYEETGAADFDIVPVWDYHALNPDGTLHNNGRVYFANVRNFDPLPDMSEMERIDFFSELPDNITYNNKVVMLEMLEKAHAVAIGTLKI